MVLPRRLQQLGTAHLAVGLWVLVAALVACVTWPGPKDASRADLYTASLPVVGLVGAYLGTTALLHLCIGGWLRQGCALPWNRFLFPLFDHLFLLLLIGKISLRNPASPVYLTGMDLLLGVSLSAVLLSLATGLATWLALPKVAGPTHTLGGFCRLLPWLHVALTLGLLLVLWRLDGQPLLLGTGTPS